LRDWDQRGNELPLGLTEVTGVTCWRRRHDDFRGEGLEIGQSVPSQKKTRTRNYSLPSPFDNHRDYIVLSNISGTANFHNFTIFQNRNAITKIKDIMNVMAD